MANFVLVHGAYDGGWAWKGVRQPLEQHGHVVCTPTLTGQGERVHLASPEIGLDTHVQDIVNVLEYEDLHSVILLGHSYGGMVITGVADRIPERIQHLVYLDAFAPLDGESMLDLSAPDDLVLDRPSFGQQLRALARAGAWQTSRPERNPRQVPFLIKPATDPIRLKNGAPKMPRTYIRCIPSDPSRRASPDFGLSAERARTEPGWTYHELDAGHGALWDAPAAVAALLMGIPSRLD